MYPQKLLSKSKYLNGLQCPRLLWVSVNASERLPEPNAALQHIFDQGHLVGELAKKLYPGGIDLPSEDFMANIRLTREALKERKPLFEAAVMAHHLYSRADILNPVGDDEWDIIEVKSSTSVKDVNLHDVSFQKMCFETAGVKIRNCYLACIDNRYVRQGEINPRELFTVNDITEEVTETGYGIAERAREMLGILALPECPESDIGPHCTDPYTCALTDCWEGLPEHNVFTLYYGGKKSHELYRGGFLEIAKIPADFKLNDKQRIQCACVRCGQPHVENEPIRQFLAVLKYPLYYLDFETFAAAVPLFDGTRPYQNIPFQFSLHVQGALGGEVKHFAFLAEGRNDPRPGLLYALSQLIGSQGSIIAYNKSFEENVLKELAAAFPEYADWVEGVLARTVDLIVPFRGFYYYHPSQKGSASLKSVLPAITGSGYEEMAIASGDIASLAFLSMTFEDIPAGEAAKIRQDLLAYCGLDTEAMVRIVEKLGRLSNLK